MRIVRYAAPMLDRAFTRLGDVATHATRVTFGEDTVSIYPDPADFDRVAEVMRDEFGSEGWVEAGTMRSPLTFVQPSPGGRPNSVSLSFPAPAANVPLTAEVIKRYADNAADVVRDILTRQARKEDQGETDGQ